MSKKAVCSAEIIVVGNVDLLSEILVRVPAKSLVKFKSVSKQWLSLISDSHFCRNHTRQNPSPPFSGLYLSPYPNSLPLNNELTRIPFIDDQRPTTLPNFSFLDGSGAGKLQLLHSSNGLMLCSNWGETYLVCNLTTQKFVVLPKLAIVSKSNQVRRCYTYLIFDPTKSLSYKVVVVTSFNKNTAQFDMYSSENGSWKSTVATPGLSHPWPGYGAIWNGAIFWMWWPWSHEPCSEHHHVYYRFDIDTEKLSRAQVASPDRKLSRGILHFGECGGRLFLIPIPCESAMEFWVLEMMHRENEFQWTVKYIVDATPLKLP